MKISKKFFFLIFTLFIILQAISPQAGGVAAPDAQSAAQDKAQALLNTLTPEEKVGQLFLVTFQGQDVNPESQIYNLIANHHIGGVVLEAENGNFDFGDNTLPAAVTLIQSLQQIEFADSQEEVIINQETLESFLPTYIPLFIGISQNGDGYPYDQIYNGLTDLPNAMAIGATWNTTLAEQVGAVAGRELAALGFNFLLGPSLDVLENPSPESEGDLGVRTFGGDPFWVGQMGSAYVRGVHQGSEGKIAVIARNFPGYGSSDRPPQDEVATVRKPLEQLKQFELAAFAAVTGNAASPESAADGLLLSHIRYQGLQGNIRLTTNPISFDQQAFSTIIGLPEFSSWRGNGGIVVTDDLSSRAVSRFYDPTGTNFLALDVLRDAFNAGSDLLFAGNITSSGDPDSVTSIIRALEFFTQRYEADPEFASSVDTSVLRLLTLKYELYETFDLEIVQPNVENLDGIGNSDAISLEVAKQGVTLLSPSLEELGSLLPVPALSDRIIFITDTSTFQQCSQCPATSTLGPEALQQAVYRLYGLEAGNQVVRQNLYSFTFDELQAMLDSPDSYHVLKIRMQEAEWLVFSMLDVRADRPTSQALRRLLSERDDLIRNKRVIVFAFNAPYYLDTTDITKLTAYFGMYSKSSQFVDTAARILFKEFTSFTGDPPVTVDGIQYELIEMTAPDPQQTISVLLNLQPNSTPEATAEQEQIPNVEPTAVSDYNIGDVIPVRTSVILDHNGNPVPDGTVVQFIFTRAGIGTTTTVLTKQGVADTTHLVNGGGQLEIRAISDQAIQSEPLIIDIPGPEATLLPTPTPSVTPSPSPTVDPTLPPTPMLTPQPEIEPHTETDFVDWGLGFLVTLAVSLIAYRAGITFGQVRWSIRWALCAWIGGLMTYLYLSLNLPGSLELLSENGRAGVIWTIAIGAGVGWGAGWIWNQFARRNHHRPLASSGASIPAKTRNG